MTGCAAPTHFWRVYSAEMYQFDKKKKFTVGKHGTWYMNSPAYPLPQLKTVNIKPPTGIAGLHVVCLYECNDACNIMILLPDYPWPYMP